MDPINIVGIVVALIAAFGAWASQRSASKANITNTTVTSRMEMEKEAYERARAFDTETIRRQDAELVQLREDNKQLVKQIHTLEERLTRVESKTPVSLSNLEDLLNDRIKQPDSTDPEQPAV